MKASIIERLKQLGANVDNIKGESLKDDILSITFDTVLYPKPSDAPWAEADNIEPIYGLDDFIEENESLLEHDPQALFDKIIEKYYCLTEEGYGQVFWSGILFTPFKKGTLDYEEWHSTFEDETDVDLKEIKAHTNDDRPDFIQIFYSYGYPDHLYITLSDPNPNNPTVFGTDHEVYFSEVDNEGSLEDYLNQFMTKDELIDMIKDKIKRPKSE